MVNPQAFDRRIPTYRTHSAKGATFVAMGATAAIDHYGDPIAEMAALRSLALVDLNALPRCGFKNAGAPEWLASKGVRIPDTANKALRLDDGGLCLRLGGTDILVTSDPCGESDMPNRLLKDWAADPSKQKGWDAHREDGFNWFLLSGSKAPEMWSRVCAVDMDLASFKDLDVAQTRAIGMGGVIVRADIGDVPAYHLFFDIASSDYLIESFEATMAEFEGRLAGLSALRLLRSSADPMQ